MPREYSRSTRVADYLRRELASLIQLKMSDPRLAMVSVTDVELSRDLAHAHVYFTVPGKDSAEEASEVSAALNRAAGFMRHRLSKESGMRMVPQLRFHYDASVGRGRYMEELIQRALAADDIAGRAAAEKK